jgi:dTMP kinase
LSRFITFEGPEGSGKTTQIALLADALRGQGRSVVTTREPGGTRIGDAIRSVLLNSAHVEMSPRAEALLFNAARAQLVDEVIQPALVRGDDVLCDRYGDSTLAYQGYGHGRSIAELRQLIAYATHGLAPDLTIYLDLDVHTGLARKRTGTGDAWNRMEEKALAFHEAVRDGYLALAAESPRWLVVDAGQPVATVAAAIWARVEQITRGTPEGAEPA